MSPTHNRPVGPIGRSQRRFWRPFPVWRVDLPILANQVTVIEAALAETGDDQDADGLTDAAEGAISTAIDLAISSVRPASVLVVDSRSNRRRVIRAAGSAGRNRGSGRQRGRCPPAGGHQGQSGTPARRRRRRVSKPFSSAQEEHKWEINLEGVAAIAFGGDVEKASRAVGLFNGYCARCHTSGWSAGCLSPRRPGREASGRPCGTDGPTSSSCRPRT